MATFVKTAVATVLTVVVTDLTTEGVHALDVVTHWQAWIVAGLVASLPLIINWLNPTDTRYGVVDRRARTSDTVPAPRPASG